MEPVEKMQESMTPPEPRKEHQWLQKLVGEWTFESEASMGPDQAPLKCTGTESVRSLGGLWVQGEGQGEMPGPGIVTSVITIGFDPEKERFVGTFIASVMTHLWLYDGALDSSEKVLTLETEGPDFVTEGKMVKYKDVIEFKSDDHRVMSSHMLGDDGQWREFMRANYHRKK